MGGHFCSGEGVCTEVSPVGHYRRGVHGWMQYQRDKPSVVVELMQALIFASLIALMWVVMEDFQGFWMGVS